MTDEHKRADLDSALERYYLAAKSTRRVRKGRPVLKWAMYTAAAGSALGAPAVAEAGVIYSGVQNITLTRTGTSATLGTSVDLDGNSIDDIKLTLFGNAAYAYARVEGVDNQGSVLVNNGGALRLSASSTVQNAGSWWQTGTMRLAPRNGAAQGFWPGGYPMATVGYAGARFEDNADLLHMAWLRLELRNDDYGMPDQLTLVDWAYESEPYEDIHIPEPHSLALLAAGAAGISAFRKRRRGEE